MSVILEYSNFKQDNLKQKYLVQRRHLKKNLCSLFWRIRLILKVPAKRNQLIPWQMVRLGNWRLYPTLKREIFNFVLNVETFLSIIISIIVAYENVLRQGRKIRYSRTLLIQWQVVKWFCIFRMIDSSGDGCTRLNLGVGIAGGLAGKILIQENRTV